MTQVLDSGRSVYDTSGKVSLALDPALFTNAPMLKAAKVLDGPTSWQDAIEQAGLDFEVVKRPLTFRNDGGGYARIPGFHATVRTDTGVALGIVKDRYTIVPNRTAGGMIDTLLDDGSLKIVGAGTFRQGATGFVIGRIPADVTIGGVDPLNAFIVISWSHDGTRPVAAQTMMLRPACANQLPLIVGKNSSKIVDRYIFRHVGSFEGRVNEARQALRIGFTAATYFEQTANDLLKTEVNAIDAMRLTELLIPSTKDEVPARTQNRRDAIVNLFGQSPNLQNVRNTGWAYFNAVAEYADHVMPARETKQTSRDENRAVSVFDGQADRLKRRALAIVREHAA
jgi:phage/plasmid-like protein (TIGR03299 family)